jgi:hypothetical protein
MFAFVLLEFMVGGVGGLDEVGVDFVILKHEKVLITLFMFSLCPDNPLN